MSALSFLSRPLLTLNHVSVFPLIFHSIPDEIPEASRPIMTRIYQLWLVLLATLIINMVACIFILVSGSASGGADLGASIGSVYTSEREQPTTTQLDMCSDISSSYPYCLSSCGIGKHITSSLPNSGAHPTGLQTCIQWVHEGEYLLPT